MEAHCDSRKPTYNHHLPIMGWPTSCFYRWNAVMSACFWPVVIQQITIKAFKHFNIIVETYTFFMLSQPHLVENLLTTSEDVAVLLNSLLLVIGVLVTVEWLVRVCCDWLLWICRTEVGQLFYTVLFRGIPAEKAEVAPSDVPLPSPLIFFKLGSVRVRSLLLSSALKDASANFAEGVKTAWALLNSGLSLIWKYLCRKFKTKYYLQLVEQ